MTNEKKILLFPVASHFLFHFYEIAFPALAIPLTLSLNMSLKDVLELGFPMYLMFGLFALALGILRRSLQQPARPHDRLFRLCRGLLPHGPVVDAHGRPVVAGRCRDFLLHLPPGRHGPHLPRAEKPGGGSGHLQRGGDRRAHRGALPGGAHELAGWLEGGLRRHGRREPPVGHRPASSSGSTRPPSRRNAIPPAAGGTTTPSRWGPSSSSSGSLRWAGSSTGSTSWPFRLSSSSRRDSSPGPCTTC